MFVLQELRLAKWLEQVNITLANTEEVSFDTLQELLETGNTLPQKTGMQDYCCLCLISREKPRLPAKLARNCVNNERKLYRDEK